MSQPLRCRIEPGRFKFGTIEPVTIENLHRGQSLRRTNREAGPLRLGWVCCLESP